MGFKWVLEHLTLSMASEIFGTAAIFWVLIPIGLAGGALLLKLQGDD
jgi:cytochrome b6-f complex subunit 7